MHKVEIEVDLDEIAEAVVELIDVSDIAGAMDVYEIADNVDKQEVADALVDAVDYGELAKAIFTLSDENPAFAKRFALALKAAATEKIVEVPTA